MEVEPNRTGAGPRRFEILVVCTANLCRSPMIEALLRATLAGHPGAWSVSSAGTLADDGRPVHPLTARALAEQGIDLPAGWLSRLLRPADVDRADLVLTAARSHRSEVVRTDPGASARTFTLRQFLRLLRTPDVEPDVTHRHAHPGDVLLDAALAARGLGPAAADDDDIPDPVGRPYRVFRDLAAEIADEIRVLNGPVASIRPVSTSAPRPVPTPLSPRPSGGGRPGPWWALRSS